MGLDQGLANFQRLDRYAGLCEPCVLCLKYSALPSYHEAAIDNTYKTEPDCVLVKLQKKPNLAQEV